MASYTNYKHQRIKNLKSQDMSKRPMNIKKSDELTNDFEDKLIDYATFYKRNIHRFVEHYFGIKLHFYQKIMLYLMSVSPLVVLLCARACI